MKTISRRALVLGSQKGGVALLFLVLAAGLIQANENLDWPVFRGNLLQTGEARSELPDTLKVRWTFKTQAAGKPDGAVDSTAVIVDGVVYIGAYDKALYALDLKTGKEKWRYPAGPIKTAAGVKHGAVFVGDEDGVLHCIDAKTGKQKWTFKTEGGAEITSGIGFAEDSVLFGCVNETLYCLSQKDGKKRWEYKVPGGPVNATPAVSGGATFVAGCDNTLHVIDIKTGKEIKAVELPTQVGSTAAVEGDMVYVGTMGADVVAVNWKKGEIVWTGKSDKGRQQFFAAVAVSGDKVFAASRDRRVYAFDKKTGKTIWSFQTKKQIDSSPVIAGKRLYIGSPEGKLYVLDRDTGKEVAALELDGGISTASPAVAGKNLVIGTEQGTIYCLGE